MKAATENTWAWLGSHKTSFTKAASGLGPDAAPRPRDTNPCSGVESSSVWKVTTLFLHMKQAGEKLLSRRSERSRDPPAPLRGPRDTCAGGKRRIRKPLPRLPTMNPPVSESPSFLTGIQRSKSPPPLPPTHRRDSDAVPDSLGRQKRVGHTFASWGAFGRSK